MPRRLEAHRKRLTEAINTYLFLEVGQRYGIPSIIKGDIDQAILENKAKFKDKFQEMWAINHKCDIKGCKECLTVDGGMKRNQFICANKMSGMMEYSKTDLRVMTGCPSKPQTNSKFFTDCNNSTTPTVTSNTVTKETTLRYHRTETATFKETNQDQIYIIESLLGKKKKGS